jgi:hypothetical protein
MRLTSKRDPSLPRSGRVVAALLWITAKGDAHGACGDATTKIVGAPQKITLFGFFDHGFGADYYDYAFVGDGIFGAIGF